MTSSQQVVIIIINIIPSFISFMIMVIVLFALFLAHMKNRTKQTKSGENSTFQVNFRHGSQSDWLKCALKAIDRGQGAIDD